MEETREQRVGQVRPSQIMFAYGVGAIVDLPHLSVIVMGLDDWDKYRALSRPISDERLLQVVQWTLGDQVRQLLNPPTVTEGIGLPDPLDEANQSGVPVALFPRWMVCPKCRLLAPINSGLFRIDHHRVYAERSRCVHVTCNRANEPAAVPARFMVACVNGHLDDFPWREFAHYGRSDCTGTLRLLEYGPAGEAREVEVYCDEHKKGRRLSVAFGNQGKASMPQCRGRRPHLRDFDPDGCGEQVKAIILGASNLWFPEVITALAVPISTNRLSQLIEDNWALLQNVQSEREVSLLRTARVLTAFAAYPDQEVWQAVTLKRQQMAGGVTEEISDLKTPEWKVLTQPAAAPASDDFQLRQVDVPIGFGDVIERVVLVERLREVKALIGFTRIDAPTGFGETPEAVGGQRMRLSRTAPPWVPATEVRGEGIFMQFKEAKLQEWLANPALLQRDAQFFDAHRSWRRAHHIEPPEEGYPGMRFVLLHSFSHAIMRQLSLECGYAAASVRERIYARNPNPADPSAPPMAGILIYTSAPDSEGTLGGLVSLGVPGELGRHITTALRHAELCASDPLCAEHLPSRGGYTLHAAACHACLFSPETSCERGNKYLDRSVLVPTVEPNELAFFKVA